MEDQYLDASELAVAAAKTGLAMCLPLANGEARFGGSLLFCHCAWMGELDEAGG